LFLSVIIYGLNLLDCFDWQWLVERLLKVSKLGCDCGFETCRFLQLMCTGNEAMRVQTGMLSKEWFVAHYKLKEQARSQEANPPLPKNLQFAGGTFTGYVTFLGGGGLRFCDNSNKGNSQKGERA